MVPADTLLYRRKRRFPSPTQSSARNATGISLPNLGEEPKNEQLGQKKNGEEYYSLQREEDPSIARVEECV